MQQLRVSCKVFQFTPLREGRHLRRRQTVRERKFQFTPLREGRLELRTADLRRRQFQFTPLREGRLCKPGTARKELNFNSRPCERGDSKIKQNMLCFFCNYREKLLTFRQHQLS